VTEEDEGGIDMRVRDIMSRPVFTVLPTDPVEGAAALLADRGITAAPVVDDRNRLVGMVSEGDLLRDRVPEEPTAHLRTVPKLPAHRPHIVAEVMTREVVTAWPLEDVADVARTMLDRDVRSVPVLDGGHVVGIVSRRDLLRSVLRTDDVLAHEVQQRLDAYAGGASRWTATVDDGVVRIDGPFDDDAERGVVEILARTVPGVAGVTVKATAR
jgi:CBS domain-containing protein